MNALKFPLLFSIVVILGACSSTPSVVSQAPVVTVKPVAAMPDAPAPAAVSAVTAPVLPAHLDPKNPIAAMRSVFFPFDQYVVEPTQLSVVERHGAYLKANPSLRVMIEGNTDERGGAEYNLALGQKRAEAVVNALTTMGVKRSQVEAVSWGREKPKSAGHDEASWAQNRRVDIQYPTK